MKTLAKEASFWQAIGDTLAALTLICTLIIYIESQPQPLPQQVNHLLSGKPTFVDSLATNTRQGLWDEQTTSFGSCKFREGAYYVTSVPYDTIKVCLSDHFIISDFVVQVQVKIHYGNIAGIIIRWHKGKEPYNDYYYFFITSTGRYGIMKAVYRNCPGQNCIQILYAAPSQAINPGLDTINTLTLIASDNKFLLFINNQFLCTILDRDAPYYTGGIGLATGFEPSEAAFFNIKIWEYQSNSSS